MKKWETLERPGYFGRRRDQIIERYNTTYGIGGWRLAWLINDHAFEFEEACRLWYEESYFLHLQQYPLEIDFICSFGECIDNAITNIESGCDYTKQEAFSTHIQDIAVRNVLKRMGRWFQGPKDKILTIRSADSNGFKFGPGNVPFSDPNRIVQPSLCPTWANEGSVEDFWQSNKYLQIAS
jgi:hypothetical protein